MPDPAPNPELMRSLGRLVRGLSALFWGLPLALVVCPNTATFELVEGMVTATAIAIPFDVQSTFGKRGRVPVRPAPTPKSYGRNRLAPRRRR